MKVDRYKLRCWAVHRKKTKKGTKSKNILN